MSSIDTWPAWIAICFSGGPFLLIIMTIAYSQYLSRRYLDAMMDALKNSYFTYTWGHALRTRGLYNSGLLISMIAGMILTPRAALRMGQLDPDDLERFPPHLKRLLRIKSLLLIISCAWLVIVGLLINFR